MPKVPVIEIPRRSGRRRLSPSPEPSGDVKMEPSEEPEELDESERKVKSESPEPHAKTEVPCETKPEPSEDESGSAYNSEAGYESEDEYKPTKVKGESKLGKAKVKSEESKSDIKGEIRPVVRGESPAVKKRSREISSPEDTKPEKAEKKARIASGSASPSIAPKEKKPMDKEKKPVGGKGRLSGDELVLLFHAAIGDGPKRAVFDDLIPGRTGKQLHDNWTKTIEPYIAKALMEKGDK